MAGLAKDVDFVLLTKTETKPFPAKSILSIETHNSTSTVSLTSLAKAFVSRRRKTEDSLPGNQIPSFDV